MTGLPQAWATPYPNVFDDPDSISADATPPEKKEHTKNLRTYSTEMLEAYKSTCYYGEKVWLYFLTAFRPQKIKAWGQPMLYCYTRVLLSRGRAIEMRRGSGTY